MKSLSKLSILLFLMFFSFSSCELVGGIFKAGFNTAIFLVVLIIVIILFFVFRGRKK